MNKILLISDNEILNQLYITNLEVYLGAEIFLAPNLEKAFVLLRSKKFDLILATNLLSGQEIGELLVNELNKYKLSIHLVLLGGGNPALTHASIVPSSYNLPLLIKSCAKLLGITAKEMAEKEIPQFYPIGVRLMVHLDEAPVALYLQMKNETHTLVVKKGGKLEGVVKKFLEENIETFFVNSADRLTIVNAISFKLCDLLKSLEKSKDGQDKKNEALRSSFLFVASCFTQIPVASAEIMLVAHECTKMMTAIVDETSQLKKLTSLMLASKDSYLYTHCVLSAYVANHIIKRVPWGGESHIDKVNFVLFFHDIVLAPLYLTYPDIKFEEDFLFDNRISDKEKDLVLNHAKLSAELLVTYKRAPIGVDLLIKQHHGSVNGIGFAREFKDDISPLSKVVIISEAFVEEFIRTQEENPGQNLNVKKIISALLERFKRNTYRKIVETLNDLSI